jgi:hypothetical protein
MQAAGLSVLPAAEIPVGTEQSAATEDGAKPAEPASDAAHGEQP